MTTQISVVIILMLKSPKNIISLLDLSILSVAVEQVEIKSDTLPRFGEQ